MFVSLNVLHTRLYRTTESCPSAALQVGADTVYNLCDLENTSGGCALDTRDAASLPPAQALLPPPAEPTAHRALSHRAQRTVGTVGPSPADTPSARPTVPLATDWIRFTFYSHFFYYFHFLSTHLDFSYDFIKFETRIWSTWRLIRGSFLYLSSFILHCSSFFLSVIFLEYVYFLQISLIFVIFSTLNDTLLSVPRCPEEETFTIP